MRLLIGLILAALAVAVSVFFAERPGAVSIIWQGYRIDTSFAVLILVLGAAIALLWFIARLLSRLLRTPREIARRRREARRLRGYREITLGLVAIAAGDGREAEKQRRRAEISFTKGALELPPLARLLAAQSALLRDDAEAAKREFKGLLDDSETAFLGLRGLIVQALKEGDQTTAQALTERATLLRPHSGWILQSRLALAARGGEWERALTTLRDAVRRRAISVETGRRHKQILLLSQARAESNPRTALSLAASAHALDEAFPPAAIFYAGLLQSRGRHERAIRVLENAWVGNAHPELADAFVALVALDPQPRQLRRYDQLIAIRRRDPLAHLIAGEAALSQHLWGDARRHLELAGSETPGPHEARLCRAMAELERGDRQDESAARHWLDRLPQAPEPPRWLCGACGAETQQWQPVCASCHGFATLEWRLPNRAAAQGRLRATPMDYLIPPDTESFAPGLPPHAAPTSPL